MQTFQIKEPDKGIEQALRDKIENLAKPKGSLGRLESLALQIGVIQQRLNPELRHPMNVIYAADHGIADEGVSKSPKEVTRQVVYNFLNEGSGVCFLARQHGFGMKVVDGGVDFDFPANPKLIVRKVRKGTRNYLHEAAMTTEEVDRAIQYGAGSGLDAAGVRHKYEVLKAALDHYEGDKSPLDVLRYFGGIEMVMAVGGMLRAAELGMIILVDGFIMTNCVLMASRLYPAMLSYCVFGHCGDESGHKLVLDFLGAEPLLHLGLRLGEGSGAVCAYPIVDSAVRMINEMHSFAQAAVTKYI
mgnify:CR=1 FL=1